MPISADPTRTVEFSLELDRDKPIESRPVFICRYLTVRQTQKIGEMVEDSKALGATVADNKKFANLLLDIIAVGVVGWRNVKDHDGNEVPYSRESLCDFLTDEELLELAGNYRHAIAASEVDLKKSLRLSRSSTEKSAVAETPKPA